MQWRCTENTDSHARCVRHRCNGSYSRKTKSTTALAARPAARSSPIARCRVCSKRAGRAASTSWSEKRTANAEAQRSAEVAEKNEADREANFSVVEWLRAVVV